MSGPVMAALSKQLFGVLKSLQHQAAADVNLTIEQRVANMVKEEIGATVSGSQPMGLKSIHYQVEQLEWSEDFEVTNDWMGGYYRYRDLSPETDKRKYFYSRIKSREMPLKYQNYYGHRPNKSLVALLKELKDQARISETLFMLFGGIQYKKQGYELGKFNPDQRLYDAQAKRRRSVRV